MKTPIVRTLISHGGMAGQDGTGPPSHNVKGISRGCDQVSIVYHEIGSVESTLAGDQSKL